MTKRAALRYCAFASSCLVSAVTQGQTLFSDNFDTTLATAWTINAKSSQDRAVFLFDYSSVGIPAAPNSGGTTIGVMLQANRPGGTPTLTGVSISPTGQSFAGDYELRYDLWANFQGPMDVGGAGSTQITSGGIMTAGASSHYAGSSTADGLWFATTGDGQSSSDYRVYFAGNNQTTASASVTYAAGSQNQTAAYYSGFGNVPAPAAQLALYPGQTGNTSVGAIGMEWHDVAITKVGNMVTWDIDGLRIASVDLSTAGAFGGSNILFAQSDTSLGQVAEASDPLLFGLIDNVRVTAVPEPATYALFGLGALGLAAFRRQRR